MTKFELPKGVKDWYYEDAVLRNEIKRVLRATFERYGYSPLETPIIEKVESLGFKGGGEIQKEVFRLSDQGNRDLALRFDQTVPLSRFVATHRDLKFPFKRYAIGPVFRDGPSQVEQGRYRQFWQCDVDVAGIKEMSAEAELFALASDVFEELGLGQIDIRVNNRKLLEGILDYANVPPASKLQAIITLDKKDKIGLDGIESDLRGLTTSEDKSTLSNETLTELFDRYKREGTTVLKDSSLQARVTSELGSKGYEDISALFERGLELDELFRKVADYRTTNKLILPNGSINNLLDAIQISRTNQDTYNKLEGLINSEQGREGLSEVKQLLDYTQDLGLDNVILDPCLARGLDYYTGTAIEVFLRDKSICPSAILGGGRYDDMIGDFLGTGEEIPAVGFAFGLERLAMVLKDYREKLNQTNTALYIIPIGDTKGKCLGLAHELRKKGLNVDMVLQDDKKVGKSIAYASSLGIPYVGLIGEEELEKGTVNLKNLETGMQEEVKIEDIPYRL